MWVKLNKNKYKIDNINYKIVLAIIFLTLVLIKLKLVLPTFGPVVFGDEFVYKNLAESIYKGSKYYSSQYPPMYPFVIMTSFIFKDNFHKAIKIINVIISSLIVLPTWLIARIYLDKLKSLYCVILSCFLPYHLIFPKLVMSENLFYPLFLITVYFVLLSSEKLNVKLSILTGIFITLCYFTRYITLAIIPILVIVWWLKPTEDGNIKLMQDKRIKERIYHFFIITISAFVTFIPWLYIGISQNWSIEQILGLSISGTSIHSIADYATINTFLMWTLIYLFYLILMVSPYINFILMLPIIYLKGSFNKYKKFIISVSLITGAITFAAIRHSWRALYNYPTPMYVIGRYILYVSVLWIISAFILISEIENYEDSIKRAKLVAYSTIFAVLLIFVSYKGLIKGDFWGISKSFIISFNALDVFAFKKARTLLYLLILLIATGLYFIINPRRTAITIVILSILFYGITSFFINKNTIFPQGIHGKNVASAISLYEQKYKPGYPIYIYDDIGVSSGYFLDYSLKFWNIDDKKFKILPFDKDALSKNGLYLTKKQLSTDPLIRYYIGTNEFYIYKLPLKINFNEIIIEKIHPSIIKVGNKFNVQPNGMSAMAIMGKNFIKGSTLYINGKPFNNTVGNENLITTLIPDEIYSKPGVIEVQITYELADNVRVESNKVVINIIN